jgi:hypothetical protein
LDLSPVEFLNLALFLLQVLGLGVAREDPAWRMGQPSLVDFQAQCSPKLSPVQLHKGHLSCRKQKSCWAQKHGVDLHGHRQLVWQFIWGAQS